MLAYKSALLFFVALLLYTVRACEEGEASETTARQGYFPGLLNYDSLINPWPSAYYFKNPLPLFDYRDIYEGRTIIDRLQPRTNPFSDLQDDENGDSAVSRIGYSALGSSVLNNLFNNRFTPANTFRPFAGLTNRLPISVNPNYAKPFANYESCTSLNGEDGICASVTTCNVFGGKASGSCAVGIVCCINSIPACRSTTTLNNTYWQSPTTGVSPSSTCAMTVKLDARLTEQRKPICQVRLDFISFSISQPNAQSVCSADNFKVGGASNKIPIVCGDGDGQHMYLEVPSSVTKTTDLQLLLNFDATVAKRSWNIKIAMLPCGAPNLAPSDCLQYYTSSTGKISSFNWKDVNPVVSTTPTRQLAEQEYNICFRAELADAQAANKLCLKQCASSSVNGAFRVSGATTLVTSGLLSSCINDFVIIPGGTDSAVATSSVDRYCGARLHPTISAVGGGPGITTVCTTVKPFRIFYHTNDNEPLVAIAGPPAIPADIGNLGFCLDFEEQTA